MGHGSATRRQVRDRSRIRLFASQEGWAAWLEKNFLKSRGLWLRMAKKGSGLHSISYREALDLAPCYGWISGQAKSETDETWLARFVPRSPSSIWSKINRDRALALIERGEMKPAGLAAIERARKSGRWERAYDSPSRAVVPPDLRAALDANPRAKAFFESLDGANRYAVLFRIQTVQRPATRAKKICQFVEMLGRNEKIHPSRKPLRSPRKRRSTGSR